MIFKRAAAFALLMAVSVYLFPLLAFALAAVRIPYLVNFLFFWPEYMLVPYGFINNEIGQSEAFLMDSAIIGAVAFWTVSAIVYGYFMRHFKVRYAVLGTYPAALVVMFLFYSVLYQFGYSVYLEGL